MTDDLTRLLDTFTDSVFRLETLQDYPTDEYDERQRVFLAEGRLLPPPPRKVEWLAWVRDRIAAGRRVGRVHVVDYPLSDYLRYELAVYAEGAAAGEDARIADRAAHPDLHRLRNDFILVDGDTDHPTVVWLDHDPDGRPAGWQISRGDRDVDGARLDWWTALTHSVPLHEVPPA